MWNESISPDIDTKVKTEVSKHVPDLMERIRLLEERLQERAVRTPFPMRGRTLLRRTSQPDPTGPTGSGPGPTGSTGPTGAEPSFLQSFDSVEDIVIEVPEKSDAAESS